MGVCPVRPAESMAKMRCGGARLLLGLSLAVLLGACAATREASGFAPRSRAIRVVTTFLPITLFTRAVAGDCATVTSLVPPGSGPHDFQARPGDLVALAQARVLVKNGLAMEAFLDKLVAAAGPAELLVVDASRGITTLASDRPGGDPDHGHGHGHGRVNPHIWLDPLRAVQQVENIRAGLVKADPSCAERYRRNASAFIHQLRGLNSEIAGQLRPYRGKTFVAFHDFAPYFAERYGLRVSNLVDVPELNPSPADLRRVAAAVTRTQLQALLSEPQEGNRSFNALAQDLGVRISVFDPMETGSAQAARDPATYLQVMRRNAANLRQVFGT